jgi:catechol 2,3-dioxygenase-like lactoylglutathione lyase family enzyme
VAISYNVGVPFRFNITRRKIMKRTLSLILLVCLGCVSTQSIGFAADPPKKGEFARTTIDLGVIVSDVEKSAKFYTEVVGFKEVKGFDVPADFAKDTGLTSGGPFKVRVFVLGDDETATKLKLIEMPKEKPKKNDTEFIHSELGFRYLTIFVTDTDSALKRLEKANVKPIAKGTAKVPSTIADGIFLTIVRDPDGNLVELVGPKK